MKMQRFTWFVIASLFLVMGLSAKAAQPGFDDYSLDWPQGTQRRTGAPLQPGDIWGYDLMWVRIVNDDSCLDDIVIDPGNNTLEMSIAVEACFNEMGTPRWEKITPETVVIYSGEFPVGNTYAWSVRSIPSDPQDLTQMYMPPSGKTKHDVWSYWSEVQVKTMQHRYAGAIERIANLDVE